MARCEVCGVEQFPANTVVRLDSDYNRHFFCSHQHADAWNENAPLPEEPEQREEQSLEEILEVVGQEMDAPPAPLPDPEPVKPPVKRVGRPKGSKNKPTVARKGAQRRL